MPPSNRIPPLLQPYLTLPRDESLLLLTSTLGASANWVTIRFLCDALSDVAQDGIQGHGCNVLLVSWARESEFWKQEARKGAGIDLERLKRDGRFAFVDGLSELCLDAAHGIIKSATTQRSQHTMGMNTATGGLSTQRGPQILPVRGSPGRSTPTQITQPANTTSTITPTRAANSETNSLGVHAIKNMDLSHLKTVITNALSSLSPKINASTTRKTLLILDNPDLFLALDPTIKPSAMNSFILTLHNLPNISHVLTHIQSDNPLLGGSTLPQPLEVSHHNFLVQYAHMSKRIIGVRVLDTGVARDVSGVIRVTEQRADWLDLGLENEQGDRKAREDNDKGKEFLYQVKGDGSVKVFERGAGGEG